MKKWFLLAAMMWALVDGDVLTKDTLDAGRTNIRSKTGELKGGLKKDILQDRVNIYDKNGSQKGFLLKDTLSPETYRFEHGWLKKDTLDPDRISIYDSKGNLRGYLQKDSLNPENWEFREQ